MSKANLNDSNLDKMKAADIPDVVGEYYSDWETFPPRVLTITTQLF